jgi:hypothetical protein
MARIFYVHWNKKEALNTVRFLRRAGHVVSYHCDSGTEAWRLLKQSPPDLSENVVRAVGLTAGLVDNKICAIDPTWSGLRFVVPLSNRPAHQKKLGTVPSLAAP